MKQNAYRQFLKRKDISMEMKEALLEDIEYNAQHDESFFEELIQVYCNSLTKVKIEQWCRRYKRLGGR